MARRVTRARLPTDPVLLRLPEVAARYGLPESRIRSAVKSGHFPAPLELGPRSHYWDERTLNAWERTPEAAAFLSMVANGGHLSPKRFFDDELRIPIPAHWDQSKIRTSPRPANTVQKPRGRGRPRRVK